MQMSEPNITHNDNKAIQI